MVVFIRYTKQMLVLIAPEIDTPNELTILDKLFQQGLEVYHLRKPLKSIAEFRTYLKGINRQYHKRIVIHQFHKLVKEFGLKGVHFQEKNRKEKMDCTSTVIAQYKSNGFSVSSSFHELDDLSDCAIPFDYHFLSPVFNSISKREYKGREFNVCAIDKLVVALGGITPENVLKVMELGFNGIGVLGGVWNTPSPVNAYLDIKNKLAEHV